RVSKNGNRIQTFQRTTEARRVRKTNSVIQTVSLRGREKWAYRPGLAPPRRCSRPCRPEKTNLSNGATMVSPLLHKRIDAAEDWEEKRDICEAKFKHALSALDYSRSQMNEIAQEVHPYHVLELEREYQKLVDALRNFFQVVRQHLATADDVLEEEEEETPIS